LSTTTNLVTAEQLFQMGKDSHYELIRGELRKMSPTRLPHGLVTGTLATLLGHYVRTNRLGAICGAETGFVLSLDPDIVLAPDLAFIRRERLPKGPRLPRTRDEAPDLTVEVMSPGDTAHSMEQKAHDWLAAGTAVVWVADPQKETVTVNRKNREPRVLQGDDVLSGEEVVPGFAVKVAEIFQS
jgi:Uma2 family endonuclease